MTYITSKGHQKINPKDSMNANNSKPSSIAKCIDNLKNEWGKNQEIASLWKDWPNIAGHQLSEHCSPLTFQRGILTIGTNHPQWIQALIFNRNQLLVALNSKGHKIKEIKIKQHYPQTKKAKESEQTLWAKHPSRSDVYGKRNCPACNAPSPGGELLLWGKCSFCRRDDLRSNRSKI